MSFNVNVDSDADIDANAGGSECLSSSGLPPDKLNTPKSKAYSQSQYICIMHSKEIRAPDERNKGNFSYKFLFVPWETDLMMGHTHILKKYMIVIWKIFLSCPFYPF